MTLKIPKEAWYIAIIGFIVIHLPLLFAPFTPKLSWLMEASLAGQFGDFIGGYIGSIILLFSLIFLYVTIKNQSEIFQHQQFENRFIELLKIARANSDEVQSKGERGRPVFIDIKDEIESAHEIIKNRVSEDYAENEIINFAYLVTFFGVNNSMKQQLMNYVVNQAGIKNKLTEE
jgi:hypothetical protein